MSKKYVYMFKDGTSIKDENERRNTLGGKGKNLCEMTDMGIPVPNGFIVTTEACTLYNSSGKVMSDDIKKQIDECIAQLEGSSGKKFGDPSNPLLVSVRSGARASMPGMMDTVLNLGINDTVADALAKKAGDVFAYDSYRRFIMMFADVVIGVSKHDFEHALDKYKEDKGYKGDTDMTGADWKAIVDIFKDIYRKDQGKDFTTDAKEQLYGAITAVFQSWDNERAFVYRRMNDIPYDWGTAVNVQEMVFGNMGETSGTGVVFTRNPASGENAIYGEYLMNAQGEDVVAGVRTPKPFGELAKDSPDCHKKFLEIAAKLEKHYQYVQDMEFTIEDNTLYILQTRNGKCTAQAALQFAIDLEKEGIITKEKAIQQVDPRALDQLLHPMFDAAALKAGKVLGKALPASPGAAAGKVYFDAKDAVAAKERGERVVLVRLETSPDDILGMEVSQGILTARGGNTSHAAVVARGMGTCCISGCEEIKFGKGEFTLGGETVKEGDYISLDGSTGVIYLGDIKTVPAEIAGNFGTFMSWVEGVKGKMAVRANADSPRDATKALEFGATGIGLCRTEHMFFDADRIPKMRKMILSDTEADRRAALDELLPFQKADFIGIYEVMKDLPVTIRLLDPPLHEFMPTKEEDFASLGKDMGKSAADVKARAESLHELNPMMGHRGCRLAVSYPEIAQMQTRAIIEAALEVKKSKGYDIKPEIMIPLVGDLKETRFVKEIIEKKAKELVDAAGVKLDYQIGTMIEIPRACLIADDIASEAEFFSFGTNDLTQMTYGLSRDDAGRILNDYIENNIYEGDPTARLDQTGVGSLMKIAIEKGRKARANLKIGICGEHGGEPSSIGFCHKVGLNYVSCSPFRVPIARLSAAQAALAGEKFD
ncbi:MAG: pyruvate, phosphate dikinase [Defluviitaleaceae bacterium]|nr:pyruvate, phosphate dikinase [Defluviitaleaceae bacterium]MCL2263707.1 pyruvate, phosphate dikinase [Defluviitaleaceae bacterium]